MAAMSAERLEVSIGPLNKSSAKNPRQAAAGSTTLDAHFSSYLDRKAMAGAHSVELSCSVS